MLTNDLLAFVRSSLPEPPAHVLEVGAGSGELASALAAGGYQVTAVDPAAEPGSHVRPCTLLDVTGSFDAAVAVVSLHHVEPLEESCAHLAGLLSPGALLIVDEIDSSRYDARAADWWLDQRRALGRLDDDLDAGQMVEALREHIAPRHRVETALRPYFELGEPVRGAYLHRWELAPELLDAEVGLIAAGLLPAVGYRQVARRRERPALD
jgi:SAM-dependent methyltransferase